MKKSALLLLMFLIASTVLWAQSPAKTTISDTLFDHSGNLLNGRIIITNPNEFTSADGYVVAANTKITVLVTGGVFSVGLVPNSGTTPSGTSYTATYQVSTGSYVEYWVVPSSLTSVRLAQVRIATPPVPLTTVGMSQVIPPPLCLDPSTPFPKWDNIAQQWTCAAGVAGTPGGPNTSIQFASNSAFNGSANLTWNNGASIIGLNGSIDITKRRPRKSSSRTNSSIRR
jgi:hypothetical protein